MDLFAIKLSIEIRAQVCSEGQHTQRQPLEIHGEDHSANALVEIRKSQLCSDFIRKILGH